MYNQLDQRIIDAGYAAVKDPQVFNTHGTNAEAFQALSPDAQLQKAGEFNKARSEACRQFYDAAVKLCRTEQEKVLLKQYVQQLGGAHFGAQRPVQRFCR